MLPLAACRTAHHRAFLSRAFVTAATFSSGPTSRSSLSSLLQQHSISQAASPPPTATLFAISQHTPDLASIINLLKDRHPLAIGCLSSSTGCDDDHHSLAIAHFFDDERSSYRVFCAMTEGRGKVSVGHWRPPGETEHVGGAGGRREGRQTLENAMSSGDWSGLWAGDGGDKRSSVGVSPFQGLENVEAGLVASVVAVTTPSSASPFLQDLATSYPSATLVGMLAPSTPFSTGRPRTLFWQGEVLEGGTVGVARIGEGPGKISMGWEGLVPVKESEVLIVDSCQGNLLLTFQSAATVNPNPTRHLLSLLSSAHVHPLGKDKDFFLGFLDEDDVVRRVVRILSGDPSRGGMALDCEESVETGDRVVFLHRTDDSNPPARTSTSFNIDFSSPVATRSSDPRLEKEEGVFRVASDEGVVVAQSGQAGHVESVAGAWVQTTVP